LLYFHKYSFKNLNWIATSKLFHFLIWYLDLWSCLNLEIHLQIRLLRVRWRLKRLDTVLGFDLRVDELALRGVSSSPFRPLPDSLVVSRWENTRVHLSYVIRRSINFLRCCFDWRIMREQIGGARVEMFNVFRQVEVLFVVSVGWAFKGIVWSCWR
jgi:hypothetical protein